MMEERSVSSTLAYLLAVVFLLYVLIVWWKQLRIWQIKTDMPGPIPLPLIGSAHLLVGCNLSDCFKRMRELRKHYGTTGQAWVGNVLVVTISEPVCIENTFANNKFLDRGILVSMIGEPLFRNGLLVNSGDTWKLHRKVMALGFQNNVLDKFVVNFNKNGHILADALFEEANGSSFDMYDYSILCTTDIIYETILGSEVKVQNSRDFSYAINLNNFLDVMGERVRQPWLYIDFFYKMSRLHKIVQDSVKFYYGKAEKLLMEIYERRNINKKNSLQETKIKCLVDHLIESGELTDEEMLVEFVNIVFAGSETTATTFSFAIAILGENHDIQEKVMEEQRNIFGDDFLRPVNNEDLKDMTYLDRVVKEVLRLYPPVGFILRKITEETDLGNGYSAPKDSIAVVMIHETHRDPKYYPNPEKFDPDRFLPENMVGRHPLAYIPFGTGRRICIGMRYATMQLKTLLSVVLRRYKILETVGGVAEIEKNLSFSLVVKSSIGFNVRIQPR